MPTTILTLVLAALVAINLLYFLSNHTRITNKMNSQYSGMSHERVATPHCR